MVELTLPRNSRVKKGKVWPAETAANGKKPKRSKEFKVYRYDPDSGANPAMDTYTVDLDSCGPMVLDALIKIKNEIDPTLSFRRSCREGVCGSCAMNIAGRQHAGLHQGDQRLFGRGGDLSPAAHAGGQGSGARPHQFLRPIFLDRALSCRPRRRSRKRNGSSRRKTAPSWTGFMSASSAPAARPHAPAIGGIRSAIWGRRRCCNPIAGWSTAATRKPASGWTSWKIPFRLYRCHTIMNCAKTCPKGLNPAQAIGEIKQMMVKRKT